MLKYFGISKSLSDSAVRAPRHLPRSVFKDGLFPFSFRVTHAGAVYLGFVFLLSMTATGTGNNLMFIILAALLSSIVVSGIVSRNALKQIALSLQLPENVFAGEKVSIKISMMNLKRFFPSFSIRVQDPEMSRRESPFIRIRQWIAGGKSAPAGEMAIFRKAAYFPVLLPRETRSELTVQSFPKRGLYKLEGFWISTRFPFGFFQRGRLVAAEGEILVYPIVQNISVFSHLLPFLPGTIESPHPGPGETLFSIRKYQEAESARTIDWKATAKTGELMAREYAREEEGRFCLILDTHVQGSAPELDTMFEKAVSFAASIAAHFVREGTGTEFLTPSEYVPRGIGLDHLYRILRSLAVVKREKRKTAGPSWDLAHFPAVKNDRLLKELFSEKVFKIIVTSSPRESVPSAVLRSSHVVFFDEL